MKLSETFLRDCVTLIQAPPLVGLTPIQHRYLEDETHRFIITAAGRRSRKTLIAKRKILYRAIEQRDTLWFHGAPTYQQAKDIFWDDLKSWTKNIRTYKSDSELFVRLRNGSEIHVVGLDKPERIEGRTKSWNGCHIAEFGDTKPDAWKNNIRPVLADTGGSAIIDGVPDPYKANFINHKNLAQYACNGSIPVIEKAVGAHGENGDWVFYSWFSSDVLPAAELDDIRDTTDPQTYRIEYEASFETIAGRVYHGFTPDYFPHGNLYDGAVYNPDLPIFVCFDFNVSPMTAILGHVKNGADGKEYFLAFRGYFLRNSNTKTLIEQIIDDHPATGFYYITPCQSSIARQTSQEIGRDGYRTDLAIIKEVIKTSGKGVRVYKRAKNPLEHKAIRATNAMLSHNRFLINPKDLGLKELQSDFSQLTYKEGTSAIDDSDKMRNHISKAASYLCERRWPVKHIGEKPDIIV